MVPRGTWRAARCALQHRPHCVWLAGVGGFHDDERPHRGRVGDRCPLPLRMANRTKIGQAHLLGCSRRLHFARLWAFSALSQSAAAKAAAESAMIRIFVLVALALAACTGPAPPPLPTGPWKAAN